MKMNRQRRSSLSKIVARVIVGLGLILSFFAPLVSLNASASSATAAMACCIGKSSEHCSSGLLRKRRLQPRSEPMCGPKHQSSGNGITVVFSSSIPEDEAVQDSAESQSSRVDSHNQSSHQLYASVARPCHEDCCANCAVVVRQPRPRAAGILPNASQSVRLLTGHSNESLNTTFNSDEVVKRPRPRGPPLSD